jgi:hypothetical protein
MIHHQVSNQAEPIKVSLIHQVGKVIQAAIIGMDGTLIGDIITIVFERGGVDRV